MLPARYRLTSSDAIGETIRRGVRARRGGIVVHVLVPPPPDPSHPQPPRGPARAAFAVGKSVGDSTDRHRVVRRLRAVLPPMLDALPAGTRLVVRGLPESVESSSAQLRRDLGEALSRVCPEDFHLPSEPEVVDPPPPVSEVPPRRGLSLALWWIGAPLRWAALGLLFGYRYTISPILPPTCRFHPSCSAYTLRSVQVHGLAKGVALGVWRLLRCNPWNAGGLDPVPPRGAWRAEIHPDGTPRDAGAVRFTDEASDRPTVRA